MNGCGGLPKLPIVGKAYDMYLRSLPFDADNEVRAKVNKQGTWNEKAIVCKVKHNAAFQNLEEQVTELAWSVKNYLLNKNVRAILIDAMYNGMNKDTLVKRLEKNDADYWKMLESVDPVAHKLESLDEVLCNEGIRSIVRSTLKEQLKHPTDDLDEYIKLSLFRSGEMPTEIESMFVDK